MSTSSPVAPGVSVNVEIWTDGACRGNPGPGGWGVVLRWQGHERHLWGGEPHTTNNRMELTAAVRALERLKRPCTVDLHTDSRYVRDGMRSWLERWKKNGWRKADRSPVLNADLWQALDALNSRHDVRWHWVKAHSGHPENERADALANRGIDEFALKQRTDMAEEVH